jgi:transcription elongation factor GreA
VHTSESGIQNPFLDPGELADEAGKLQAATLEQLDEWARRAAAHPQGPEWRKQGEKLLAEKRAGAVAHYAYASLLSSFKEREEAAHQLVVLCDRLSQVKAWAAIALVAGQALELDAGPPAARWLVRAVDETGTDEDRFEALLTAHEAAPGEPRLAWRLAQQLEARGEREAAIATTAETLAALAHRRDTDGLDDVLIHILEEPAASTLRLVFEPLRVFAKAGETDRVADFLEMAWPTVVKLGLAGECWQVLRRMAIESEDPTRFVKMLPDAAEAGLPGGAEARRLLGLTGISSGTEPAEALELFDKLLPFAVGAYAEHQRWGAGRVKEVTAEEIWFDFPDRRDHRMTLRAAHQVLTPVSADDLVVLRSHDPEKLATLREEDPVELVARGLRRLRKEATIPDLKRLLIHYAIPEKEWTKFWNTARARFPDDPRVDDSQAFRKIYRLGDPAAAGEEGADDASLPAFDRRANAKRVLATLRRFLEQHPDSGSRLIERRGGILRAWVDDVSMAWRQRLGALMILVESGDEESIAHAPSVTADALADGFDLLEMPNADEQLRVFGWTLESESWRNGIRSALGSRFTETKQRALDACRERLGVEQSGFLADVVRQARTYPESAITVAQLAYSTRKTDGGDLPPVDPWALTLGLAGLLEGGATPPQMKSSLALFDPAGSLARAAREQAADEETIHILQRLVGHWRGTDRSLHPFLDWLEEAGHPEVVAFARDRRKKAARAVTDKGGPVALHERIRPYFTRATYHRLRGEAEDIQQALRTTIPQAIQKARELGDLRENAEYESARLKQRQAQARLVQLAERIEGVIFIDDLEFADDVIGLGAEVTLEFEGGETRTMWLLGDGDDIHGPEVVSYRAPLGRALQAGRLGETVEIPTGEAMVSAIVRSIRHRLPEDGETESGED